MPAIMAVVAPSRSGNQGTVPYPAIERQTLRGTRRADVASMKAHCSTDRIDVFGIESSIDRETDI